MWRSAETVLVKVTRQIQINVTNMGATNRCGKACTN